MCVICVEIMRQKITMKDALSQYKEVVAFGPDDKDENTKHAVEVIRADKDGDVKRVAELVKAGYRKERWL